MKSGYIPQITWSGQENTNLVISGQQVIVVKSITPATL
jgi:hypothetical protein